MLEKYAAQVLNSYLGKYIEDFNPENLSIGLLKGAVELENLKLKKDAFQDLDLSSIEIRHGSIGKITLKISSYRNVNEPWVIDISKIYIILGAKNIDEKEEDFDEEANDALLKQKKENRLDEVEEKWFATMGEGRTIYTIWNSYSSSIITNIIENLQVRLFDVHIRYEDDVTLPHPFSFGLHISVLSAYTTDEKWQKTANNCRNETEKKWKLISLEHFSIYWKTKSEMLHTLSNDQLLESMKSMKFHERTDLSTDPGPNYIDEFLLKPVSAHVKLTHDCSPLPLRSRSKARFTIIFDIPNFPLSLDRMQYHQMVGFASQIQRWRRAPNPFNRPSSTIIEKPSTWWKWAGEIVLKKIRDRFKKQSKSYMLSRARLITRYVHLYQSYLEIRYIHKSTQYTEELEEIREIEDELNFQEIYNLRQIVYDKPEFNKSLTAPESTPPAPKINESSQQVSDDVPTSDEIKDNAPKWSWGGWLGWNKSLNEDETDDVTVAGRSAVSDDDVIKPDELFKTLDDDELYEMFGMLDEDSARDDTFLCRDHILLRIAFNLHCGSVSIVDHHMGQGVADLQFKSFVLLCELRPRHGTYSLSAELGSVVLVDLNETNEHYSCLVKPSQVKQRSTTPPLVTRYHLLDHQHNKKNGKDCPLVFKLAYKKLPAITSLTAHKLNIEMAPLSLVFIPGLWKRLKHFFSADAVQDQIPNIDTDILTSVAQEKYDLWMKQTQNEITRIVHRMMEGKSVTKSNKEKWELSLDIFAPVIIIPQNVSTQDSGVMVLNLGHITFKNYIKDPRVINQQQFATPTYPLFKIDEEDSCDDNEDDLDDEEDVFITPPNTPPPQICPEPHLKPTFIESMCSMHSHELNDDVTKEQLSEQLLREKMYEKYTLLFSDLQVFVLPSQKYLDSLQFMGKNLFNVVDRFSVELSLERRLLYTTDPRYPAVAVFAHLPHLVIHISSDKLKVMDQCFSQFDQSHDTDLSTLVTSSSERATSMTSSSNLSPQITTPMQAPTSGVDTTQSKLVTCDFLLNQISVMLEEDEDKLVLCVLEISQIQFKLTKRPFDHLINLSIYSLLLVDLMQQLGSDFDLLLASHRNVYMDPGSGTMLDSGLVSPVIPQPSQGPGVNQVRRSTSEVSTTSMTSRHRVKQQATTRTVLDNVAHNLQRISDVTQHLSNSFHLPPPVYSYDDVNDADVISDKERKEFLITVEAKYTSPDSPEVADGGVTSLNHVTAKFNSLDVVVNVTSWLAILDFLHALSNDVTQRRPQETATSDDVDKADEVIAGSAVRVEIDFKKLNVLLLRHVISERLMIGRKVATVTMSETNIAVDFRPSDLEPIRVSGSISGFSLRDLTSSAVTSSDDDVSSVMEKQGLEIIKVGSVEDEEDHEDVDPEIFSKFYSDVTKQKLQKKKIRKLIRKQHPVKITDPFNEEEEKALSFIYSRKRSRVKDDVIDQVIFDVFPFELDSLNDSVAWRMESQIEVQVASACYVHAPRFVAELMTLMDEMGRASHGLMSNHARQAYKQMAWSIVDKVSDLSLVHKDIPGPQEYVGGPGELVYLRLHMNTPILALPKCPGSYELLVANLGEITVVNNPRFSKNGHVDSFNELRVAFVDMSLKCHRQRGQEIQSRSCYSDKTSSVVMGPDIEQLKKSGAACRQRDVIKTDDDIIHKTSIEIEIKKSPYKELSCRDLDVRSCCVTSSKLTQHCCPIFENYVGMTSSDCVTVDIRPGSDLVVHLSKSAYEQLLKTMDNMAFGGDVDADVIAHHSTESFRSAASNDIKLKSASSAPSLTAMMSSREITRTELPPKNPTSVPHDATPRDTLPVTSSSSTGSIASQRKYTPLEASFRIPNLVFQLNGDLSDGDQGIVRAVLRDLNGFFRKDTRSTSEIGLSLGSLEVEDLLQPSDGFHRNLVVTSRRCQNRSPDDHIPLSKSCPQFTRLIDRVNVTSSSSLPSSLDGSSSVAKTTNAGASGRFRPFDQLTMISDGSRRKRDEDEELVSIGAFLVDGGCDAFARCYDSLHRRIKIDFNSLDCLVNLQTCVVLLDFFGIGSSPDKHYHLDAATENGFPISRRLEVLSFYENQPDDVINSQIDFNVIDFSLIFNKSEYKLLKANISRLTAHVRIRDGVLKVGGKLGSLCISDLSPNGAIYRERFIFSGERALDFDVIKHDGEDASRDYDVSIRLRMSSMRYVHTQRFHNETIAFCQHFQQLQEVLGRMRAASVGQNIRERSARASRIKLDVETGASIIIIPESSHSTKLLVANLGYITVKNCFKYSGDQGTSSFGKSGQTSETKKCLLDVTRVSLVDMDLFTAVQKPLPIENNIETSKSDQEVLWFPSYSVHLNPASLLTQKAKLLLQLERNLDKDIRRCKIPDTKLSGNLSSIHCQLQHSQYWLLRGVLDHNIGEVIPDFPQPTSFLQPPKLHTVLTGSVHVCLSIDLHLHNVSIELFSDHPKMSESLGRLDFVQSQLSFRAHSNLEKTTSLSCHAFRANDVTAADSRSCIFPFVLGPKDSIGTDKVIQKNLQFELFQRSGPGFAESTALLNNMRIYLVLGWLKRVRDYLVDNPDQKRCDELRRLTTHLMTTYKQTDGGQLVHEQDNGLVRREFTLCFTDTEFVVAENMDKVDSNAVIVRATSVLHHNPDVINDLSSKVLPFRCSLERLEVFSCQLDNEKMTELSILDPVTISAEISRIHVSDDVTNQLSNQQSIKSLLDIQISDFNMRVSYNDVILIQRIIESLQSQISTGTNQLHGCNEDFPLITTHSGFSETALSRLIELGYARADVIYAMTLCSGDVCDATKWLIENASVELTKEITVQAARDLPFRITDLSVAFDVIRVCLIDDCANDCDSPLAEVVCEKLRLRQGLSSTTGPGPISSCLWSQSGSAHFRLKCDYYNRMLSLWEPFLEAWRCGLSWKHQKSSTGSNGGEWEVQVEGSDKFDLNITSMLMETVQKTYITWKDHYNSAHRKMTSSHRQPFVPYVIRNMTGCMTSFATQTAAVNNYTSSTIQPSVSTGSWKELLPEEEISFNFVLNHEKQRHKRADSLKLHQVVVQVEGWQPFEAVTVSKVGCYFRHAYKQVSPEVANQQQGLIRVVFSVTMEGTARKVVTVRSALSVKSRVKIPLELKLEGSPQFGSQTLPILQPGDVIHIPLHLTTSSIRVRPRHAMVTGYHFSTVPIKWQDMPNTASRSHQLIECRSSKPDHHQPFHFAVAIEREKYPSYRQVTRMMQRHQMPDDVTTDDWLFASEQDNDDDVIPLLAGHKIIIMPPVVISNLLPCDLHYYVKVSGQINDKLVTDWLKSFEQNTSVEGTLKAGMDATPHTVHILPNQHRGGNSLNVGCLLENFRSCREIVIPGFVRDFQMRMTVKDHNDETLILNVRILWRLNCSVKISIMAGYWIVNKTGLPVVVKQEGSDRPSAGQYETHEEARSLQPLLFSYANREGSYLCTMRLGKKVRVDTMTSSSHTSLALREKRRTSNVKPSYCESFSTDGGTSTRSLKLITSDNSPNREFCIGISVRRGWGRYLHTHIVTVAPRFLLINKTRKLRLCVAQRHATSFSSDQHGNSCHLTIVPGSSIIFHWPRIDLDTLLCVKLADEPTCQWSGGFVINRTDAFHIALRITSPRYQSTAYQLHPLAPHCVFLNIEVKLQNATYCVSVSDADPTLIPPPLRIDNLSPATIIFKQVGTDDIFNTEVLPVSQLAYACDEPCLPQTIQCFVKGGSLNVTLDMRNIGLEKQLCYENFIYISIGQAEITTILPDTIYVLDTYGAQTPNGLSLQPLRAGKRSQLWRMTSDGRIFHEGSSPPEKGSRGSDGMSQLNRRRQSGLVLDICEVSINQRRSLVEGIPIALNPVDDCRKSTQTWMFTSGLQLICRHRGLAVQVKKLEIGSVPVLACTSGDMATAPEHMCISHKLIPGSGVLSLKIIRDGPTRVLKVVDIRQKRAENQALQKIQMMEKHKKVQQIKLHHKQSVSSDFINRSAGISSRKSGQSRIYASISLPKGIGISLISNLPEELVYVSLLGVNFNAKLIADEQIISLRVQRLQIDNQLLDGHPSVVLHPLITDEEAADVTNAMTSSKSTSIDPHPMDAGGPFISITAIRQSSSSSLYEIFKSVKVSCEKMSIQLEERLLLKILQFIGLHKSSDKHDSELIDEMKVDLYRATDHDSFTPTKRYYFDHFHFSMAPMKLGMLTTSNLPAELKSIKSAFNITLVQFQRAPVTIQPYNKQHLFETASFITDDLQKHLLDQLLRQAAKILGSVDFLGNPIGLMSDVKAGVTNLARGNFPDMVLNLTHGLSNSTAKVASSLSNGLGEMVMDEDYGNKRRAIQANARNAGGHVVAGLQGLMAGMIGGLTSVITQPVKGAQVDGAAGFLKGIGKGLIGTVAKPVTGMLDFASESASAVRDISTSRDDVIKRSRLTRSCHSFHGCLQVYSQTRAEGQNFLYALNRQNFDEIFYEMTEIKLREQGSMQVIITNQCVYIVKDAEPDPDHIFLQASYPHLLATRVLHEQSSQQRSSYFLELSIRTATGFGQIGYSPHTSSVNYAIKKPQVTCHSRSVAERIKQQIDYAKMLAWEQQETLSHDDVADLTNDRNFDMQV